MDSYKVDFIDGKIRPWIACHECKYGGNGDRSCNVGGIITYRLMVQRGCWGGEILDSMKEEFENAEIKK